MKAANRATLADRPVLFYWGLMQQPLDDSFVLCSGFLLLEELIYDRSERSADKGSNDEDPKSAHGCAVALDESNQSGTEAAGGVDGGAGETDAEDMNEGEGQTDDETAEAAVVLLLGGNAKDCDNKDEGQDDFNEDACKNTAVNARKAVGADAVDNAANSGRGPIGNAAKVEDHRKRACACKSAEALGDDVGDEVAKAHAAADQNAERNSGVDVAAGDVADAVCHGNDGETERKRGEDVAAAESGVTANEHCCAAAHEYEHGGADELGNVLLERVHSDTSIFY